MILVISTARLKPGTRDQVLPHAATMIAASRAEPACRGYDLNFSVTDADQMVFVEWWESRAALDEHFATPHFKAWRAALVDLVVSRRMEVITPAGVEVV